MEHIAYENLKKSEDIFRAIAEQNRIRIIRLLFIGGESCVCELMDALCLPQYAVSRHLTVLKRAGIVDERRDGAWRYYSIATRRTSFTDRILQAIEKDLKDEVIETDVVRFNRRLALRVNGKCVVGTDNQCCGKSGKC